MNTKIQLDPKTTVVIDNIHLDNVYFTFYYENNYVTYVRLTTYRLLVALYP